MIIAIANQNGGSNKTNLANNLALLRARSGRKVLLVNTDPKKPSRAGCWERGAAGVWPKVPARTITGCGLQVELENLCPHYNDIVIDTLESRSALIAAKLAVVPVQADQVDLESQYKLIARLNSARMFNPGLHVLFVIVGGQFDPSAAELAAIRTYVAHVMSATLSGTVIHERASAHLTCASGRCVCGYENCDARAVTEMSALYQEVFAK